MTESSPATTGNGGREGLVPGHWRMPRFRAGWARALGDRRGVAALEFALIVPLLLSLYFVTMEVAQAIETNKKVGRVSSMVADLVTQQQSIAKSELDAIMKIGGATLQPYSRSLPSIIITAIEVTDESSPQVKVVWSRKLVNGTFSAAAAKGTTTTLPAELNVRDSFAVRVETELSYSPIIAWAADDKKVLGLAAAFDNIAMRETFHLRPRLAQSIPCGDC